MGHDVSVVMDFVRELAFMAAVAGLIIAAIRDTLPRTGIEAVLLHVGLTVSGIAVVAGFLARHLH